MSQTNVESFKRAVEALNIGDIEIESPVGSLVDYKNGKAVRMIGYLDPDDAREAAGLSE